VAAITQYATEADLAKYAVNEDALRGVDPSQIEAALEGASRTADDYLYSQYVLPLTTISTSLTMNVARMAAYNLFNTVGYNPSAGQDELLKNNNAEALKWLVRVSQGLSVAGLHGSSSGGSSGQSPSARPLIISSSPRGFTSRDDAASGGFCRGTGFGSGFIND
jgi:phage gp36-like protein